MMKTNDHITTNEAAGELGVTRQRVLQLIQDGRLKAEKFANVYMIRRGDLANIEEKPMGRPPKSPATGDRRATGHIQRSNGISTSKSGKKKGGKK